MTAMLTRGRLSLLLLATTLFAVLAILALEINSEFLSTLDASVWDWLDAHRSHRGQGDSLGIFLFIGNPVHVAVAGLVSGALLALLARSAMRVVVVTGAVGLGAVIEQTIKAMTDRTPANLAKLLDGSVDDMAALETYAHSFPSGHVTGAATLLGTIAVCLGIGRSEATRAALTFIAVSGVLAVGVLALYVRAHVFTDIIGGFALGGALVALGAAAISPARRTQTRTV
jgi:membrane-associated phospholipid phosphatase